MPPDDRPDGRPDDHPDPPRIDLPDDLQRPLDEAGPELRSTAESRPPPAAESRAGPDEPTEPPTGLDEAPTELAEPPDGAADEPVLRPAVPIGPDVAGHRRGARGRVLVRSIGGGLRRSALAVAGWSRRPAGRLALPAALIGLLVGVAAATGAVLVPAVDVTSGTGPASPGLPATVPPVPAVVPTTAPPVAPTPTSPVGIVPAARADALAGWADQLSVRTGIPVVALQAYGYAELVVARTTPACRLSWTTLAAIGRVETNHGSSGGAQLLPDGRALPAIFGEALDGTGERKLIFDTDGGQLDGDPIYDRAVGPMQFIPQTWRREAVDATGNGVADIHNINDAALAAANYLCRGGRDLSTAGGWWTAVLAYNNVQAYADQVFDAANEYGQLSRT